MAHPKSYRPKKQGGRLDVVGAAYRLHQADIATFYGGKPMIGRPILSGGHTVSEEAAQLLAKHDITFYAASRGLMYAMIRRPNYVPSEHWAQIRHTQRDLLTQVTEKTPASMAVQRGNLYTTIVSSDEERTRLRLVTKQLYEVGDANVTADHMAVRNSRIGYSYPQPQLWLGELDVPTRAVTTPAAVEYFQTTLPLEYTLGAIAILQKDCIV